MKDDEDELKAAMERIRGILGEYGKNFAMIVEVEVGTDTKDPGTRTLSTWSGNYNAALGLAARLQERMRQSIIESDYPNDPPDDEQWKTGADA